MIRFAFVAVLITSLLLMGCGASRTSKDGIGGANDDVMDNIPAYVKKTPEDPNIHYEWGTGVSRDMGLASSKATQEAQNKMAMYLETRFQGLSESFKEELNSAEQGEYLEMFTEATKRVTSTVLSGVKTDKNDILNEDGRFRVYVLMSMPLGMAAEQLRTQLQQQKDMYTRYRASETFKKLDDEVDKYEQWKKDQMNN